MMMKNNSEEWRDACVIVIVGVKKCTWDGRNMVVMMMKKSKV